ncbi:helix-turn-helix domain-containing protein [Vibrio sp. YMD68]|uniref:helix-turn-helix domain-containing protein n=1 Tax=Vibrio sp. YMD68 TaxID=3042300 RepID=UPI00249AF6A3|nr:AraC family transcriptional regulator [Vibrio sp. YMD68]WGV97987.1 helix-turn-helix domain-containing protein [Vibrio sp. YMD68]
MPNTINISNSNNLLPFLNYFDQQGIEWKSVAEKYQFPEDLKEGEYWLPSHQTMAFLSTIMKSSNRRIGLEVGRLITLEQISPEFRSSFIHCDNLEQAIHTLIEVMPTLNNHVVVWPERIEGKWYLCHRGAYHPSVSGYDQAEWFRAFGLLSLCRLFLGQTWEPSSVLMSLPGHLAKDLPAAFSSVSFTFGHAFGAIEIPLSENFIGVEPQKREHDWHTTLDALINTYAVLPWFNVEWLAQLIGSSPRTLQRRLADKGLTFRQSRDNARCETATKLLREKISPFETAWRCGYTDLSNFNRAFKGWMKQTPAQYQSQFE